MTESAEGEKVKFQSGEHLVLPEGIGKVDLQRALRYREFINQRIQGNVAEPLVAGRPHWVSTLNEDEQQSLNRAMDFVVKVEKDPDGHFKS